MRSQVWPDHLLLLPPHVHHCMCVCALWLSAGSIESNSHDSRYLFCDIFWMNAQNVCVHTVHFISSTINLSMTQRLLWLSIHVLPTQKNTYRTHESTYYILSALQNKKHIVTIGRMFRTLCQMKVNFFIFWITFVTHLPSLLLTSIARTFP